VLSSVIGFSLGCPYDMLVLLHILVFIAQGYELFVPVEVAATSPKEHASFVRVRASIPTGYSQCYFLLTREE
jgi:hypothetical protein